MSRGKAGFRIRRMQIGDIDRVIAIAESLKQAPQWTRDVYEKALIVNGIQARIALVAESDGQVTGFAVGSLVPPQAELETIAVEMASQRQGIAIRLFEEMWAELGKRQITEVMLEVRESNHAARALYRFLGFVETGRRPGYYAAPQEDALLLRRPLP